DARVHGSPIPEPTERVMLPLRREVEGELHAVETLDIAIGQDGETQAIGGDARPDIAARHGIEDAPILRVEPVLADPEIEGPDRQAVADATDVFERQSVDDRIGTIAVGAP